MSEYIAIATAIGTPIATLIVGKYLLNSTKNAIKDEVLDFLDSPEADKMLIDLIQRENVQKFLYSVGGLIGSGARSGIGIGKKGGKFGFQDLIMSIAGKYLGLEQQGQNQQQEQQPFSLKP